MDSTEWGVASTPGGLHRVAFTPVRRLTVDSTPVRTTMSGIRCSAPHPMRTA
ncbi:hypothetical protein NKH18_01030 [Streptomyces sp. M10(2022)]